MQTAPTGSAGKRIRRSPEAARAEIIRAAEAALAELSFNELTVDVLMRRTGMTRSSFYHYFSGLDELLAGLLEDFERDIVASVEPWLSAGQAVDYSPGDPGQPDPHAPGVSGARPAGGRGEPGGQRQPEGLSALADPGDRRVHRQTTRFIETQVDRGLSRVDDPARTANALIRMNNAVAHDNLTGTNPDTPEAVARVLAGIWNSVIYGEPDRSSD